MDNIERIRITKYTLYSDAFGLLLLDQEPKGSRNDKRSTTRDARSRGFNEKISISLEFYGEAADYLSTVYNQYGISERVLLTKYVKDDTSLSEDWKLWYVQEFDFRTFSENKEKGYVTVDAFYGGLQSDINDNRSKKLNIIEDEAINGAPLNTLKTYPFTPQVRGIYTDSLLRNAPVSNFRINTTTMGGFARFSRSIPNKVIYNTIPDDVKEAWMADITWNDKVHSDNSVFNVLDTGNALFYRAEYQRDLDFIIKVRFKVVKLEQKNSSGESMKVRFQQATYDSDTGQSFYTSQDLLTIADLEAAVGSEYTVDITVSRTVYIEQSVGVVFSVESALSDGYLGVYLDVLESQVHIIDKTVYEVTNSRCIKPFDFFDRIIAKITGTEGLFRSDIFGPGGKYEHRVIDNGFFARNFPYEYEDSDGEVKKTQFTTSFQEAFNSLNYMEPLAWWVEVEGNKEVLRIEDAKYTQKNFVGVELTDVSDIVETAAPKDYFAEISIGHKKSVEYEAVNGLEEPNGKSEFVTHATRGEGKYSIESSYRTDPIGYELTRRFQFKNFSQKDTKFDRDIWMHDAKFLNETDGYTHNLWDDLDEDGVQLFEYAPKGIYDPETAWNLRFSPMNALFYGHGYSVVRGLYHRPGESIRFVSSNANRSMITKRTGQIELAEDGAIQISDFEKPLIEATKIQMKFDMTQELEEKFFGNIDINTDLIPRIFGLIKFPSENEDVYGRLIRIDSDDEGKLTLQKARL